MSLRSCATRLFQLPSASRSSLRLKSHDTPRNAVPRYDMDHPPVYTRPPVIPALAFSPDGRLLAVAGFHEVLLWKADGSGRADVTVENPPPLAR